MAHTSHRTDLQHVFAQALSASIPRQRRSKPSPPPRDRHTADIRPDLGDTGQDDYLH